MELDLDHGEDLTCHWIEIEKVDEITVDIKTLYAKQLFENLKLKGKL